MERSVCCQHQDFDIQCLGANLNPDLKATKAACKKAAKNIEEAKLAITMEGEKPFELYGNPLSNEARQPWEEVMKAQVTRAPWEDIYGVTHTKTPTKTWDFFCECVMFPLQQVFRFEMEEALKHYITIR